MESGVFSVLQELNVLSIIQINFTPQTDHIFSMVYRSAIFPSTMECIPCNSQTVSRQTYFFYLLVCRRHFTSASTLFLVSFRTSILVDLSSFSSLVMLVPMFMLWGDCVLFTTAGAGGANWCKMVSSALSASFTCSRALNRLCSLLNSPASVLPLLTT